MSGFFSRLAVKEHERVQKAAEEVQAAAVSAPAGGTQRKAPPGDLPLQQSPKLHQKQK